MVDSNQNNSQSQNGGNSNFIHAANSQRAYNVGLDAQPRFGVVGLNTTANLIESGTAPSSIVDPKSMRQGALQPKI